MNAAVAITKSGIISGNGTWPGTHADSTSHASLGVPSRADVLKEINFPSADQERSDS